jgi:hypothetical protein
MINFAFSRQLVEQASKIFTPLLLIYVGDQNTQLLNHDDNPPFTRVLTVDDKSALALDPNWSYSKLAYSCILTAEDPPSTTDPYWISFDNGTTKKQVNLMKYTPKHGFYELIFTSD